jgi:hypothetical protein
MPLPLFRQPLFDVQFGKIALQHGNLAEEEPLFVRADRSRYFPHRFSSFPVPYAGGSPGCTGISGARFAKEGARAFPKRKR